VIDAGSRSAALDAVAASGGRVITGGRPLDAPGYYLAPTLVELERPAGPLASEEVFAPVAAVLGADSAEQAVEIANAVRFGLVAAVFTSDLGRALRLTSSLDAGMIRVNAPTSGVDFHAPFGGPRSPATALRSRAWPRARSTPSRGRCSSCPELITPRAGRRGRRSPSSACGQRRRSWPRGWWLSCAAQ